MERLPSDLARQFGANLFIVRRRSGLSQERLSARASLHRTEISKLERGERLARIDTVIKLAGALAIAPGDLLKGMDWRPDVQRGGRFWVRADWSSRP